MGQGKGSDRNILAKRPHISHDHKNRNINVPRIDEITQTESRKRKSEKSYGEEKGVYFKKIKPDDSDLFRKKLPPANGCNMTKKP